MLQRVDERLSRGKPWDIVVIGGGATGIGISVDAASRGHSVLLLEQSDFGKGTSSRSTKLVHGGVRYLQQGNVPLVMEALKERGILRQNAPHLVTDLPFVVPNYKWWEAPFYGVGMRVYDGQFDDARLLIHLAMTAAEQGAALVNYMPVTGILKNPLGFATGVRARDEESGQVREIPARVVINATGAFTDAVRAMDQPGSAPIIRPSQGVHIVLDRAFLPGSSAIMVPQTDDGRVLFAIPWRDRVVVGTTDTPVDEVSLEPRPLEAEIEFLVSHAARYLTRDPGTEDILSVFVGIRPLVAEGDADDTAEISREHALRVSASGMLTIAGGKWTTYRKMAEDAVDAAETLGDLEPEPCLTSELNIHGYHQHAERHGPLSVYGSDARRILDLADETKAWGDKIHPRLDLLGAEVIWACREEMARTVDDVLARRTRSLVFDARAALEAAPGVASLMAQELARDEAWIAEQIHAFAEIAQGHLPAAAAGT
jgi:glycerol-3-phosphate dehydrogenase